MRDRNANTASLYLGFGVIAFSATKWIHKEKMFRNAVACGAHSLRLPDGLCIRLWSIDTKFWALWCPVQLCQIPCVNKLNFNWYVKCSQDISIACSLRLLLLYNQCANDFWISGPMLIIALHPLGRHQNVRNSLWKCCSWLPFLHLFVCLYVSSH